MGNNAVDACLVARNAFKMIAPTSERATELCDGTNNMADLKRPTHCLGTSQCRIEFISSCLARS